MSHNSRSGRKQTSLKQTSGGSIHWYKVEVLCMDIISPAIVVRQYCFNSVIGNNASSLKPLIYKRIFFHILLLIQQNRLNKFYSLRPKFFATA